MVLGVMDSRDKFTERSDNGVVADDLPLDLKSIQCRFKGQLCIYYQSEFGMNLKHV